MQAAVIEDVRLSIPNSDLSFLKTLARKMGWTMRKCRKSGLEKALDDVKAGRVYTAESVDDMFKQILG